VIRVYSLNTSGKIVELVLDTESELYFELAGCTDWELEQMTVIRGNHRQTGTEAMEELTTVFGE
jgi:hypothetical protein